jgi:hypothetical protein
VLQYYEKELYDIKDKKSCNILPHCEIGDKKFYQNLLRKICNQMQDRDIPKIFGYENEYTKIFCQEILL